MTRWLIIALAATLALACSRDDSAAEEADETEETAAEDAAPVEATDDADTQAALDEEGDEVPTVEDYEEVAEESITTDSLEAEVEAMEAEIGLDDNGYDDDDE